MLTAEGCRQRRQRLLDALTPTEPLVLTDPLHLRYLANFYVDPFSLGADFFGVLILSPDGKTKVVHDGRLPSSIAQAHVDESEVVKWYDGQSPGKGYRRWIIHGAVKGRIHDSLADPMAESIINTIGEMRRRKDPDEVEVLRKCMRVTEAGQAWARANAKPGMTELQVYTGIVQACSQAAGHAVVVYGDFAVSPGSQRRGGAATQQVIREGDMLILDFSVILFGYRSDFTNTLVIGRAPNEKQQKLYDCCVRAMVAGERELQEGASCLTVYNAVRGSFANDSMADFFPHHAGHGLGMSHPEAPFFVKHADETLVAGDVVTLEPGLYVDNVGGIRIEHNYLITPTGFERLSQHEITLLTT